MKISKELLEQKTREWMERLSMEPVVRDAFDRLESRLPTGLFYHSKTHTQNVIEAVVMLATADGLPEDDIHLLGIAAAYHDLGYIEKDKENESVGARLMEEAMQLYGRHNLGDISLAKEAIEDTALVPTEWGPAQRKKGRNDLSGYLMDADLSNLGKKSFMAQTKLLAKEQGVDIENKDAYLRYLQITVRFLMNHKWQTPAGNEIFSAEQNKNLQLLKEEVANLTVVDPKKDFSGPTHGY